MHIVSLRRTLDTSFRLRVVQWGAALIIKDIMVPDVDVELSMERGTRTIEDVQGMPWLIHKSALEEGCAIVIVELNVADFSYSSAKLNLIGSGSSFSVVHVQVMLARNPSKTYL